ncbi:MAG TPA: helix-turn-helix domain-containing protein [Naasia sp.]|jgi:transposase
MAAVAGGWEPAESLTPDERRQVLGALVRDGWSVRQIAYRVRATEYTVCRWLDTYDLRSHHTLRGGHAA